MSRIDCSKTENYFKVKERMTKGCTISCCTCPLDNVVGEERNVHCTYSEMNYPEKVVGIVQKWSDEHPVKTILDEFLEKYPKALMSSFGYPLSCVSDLGYEVNCEHNCKDCWDAPLESEE